MSAKLAIILIVTSNIVLAVTLYALEGAGVLFIFPERISPFDLATFLLGSSALILTGTALLIAILTLLGYRNIKQAALNAALREVRNKLMPEAVRAAEVAALQQVRLLNLREGDGEVDAIAAAFSKEDGQ